MPFHIRKFKTGWRVYDDKGKSYSKKPLSKMRATAQLRALYANIPEEKMFRGSGYCVMDKDMYLDGEGFFSDFFDKVKKTTSQIIQRVKDVSKGIRLGYSPKCRAMLDQYGNFIITEIYIRRKPIEKVLDKVLDAISMGKWSEAKFSLAYDSMFHLSMVFALRPPKGRGVVYMMVEKNQVINMEELTYRQVISVPHLSFEPPRGLTFRGVMNRAQDMNGNNFWTYDAFQNNCQMFIAGILQANGLLTTGLRAFILQNVEGMITQLPNYVQPVARGITDIAALADVALQGGAVIKMPVKKFVAEHKKLVKLLNESASKLGAEGAEQSAELKKMTGGVMYQSDKDEILQQLRNVEEWDDLDRIFERLLRLTDDAGRRRSLRDFRREFNQLRDNPMTLTLPSNFAYNLRRWVEDNLPFTPGSRPLITPPPERRGSGKGGMMRPTIDTSVKNPHPTTLSASKISELRDKVDFEDDMSKEDQWKVIREVLTYLLSDKSFLQTSTDQMDISSAMAEMPRNPKHGNPYTWGNVIRNVLDRLEPTSSGSGKSRRISVYQTSPASTIFKHILRLAKERGLTGSEMKEAILQATEGDLDLAKEVEDEFNRRGADIAQMDTLVTLNELIQFNQFEDPEDGEETETESETEGGRVLKGGVMYEDDYAQLVYELSRVNDWSDLRPIIRRIGQMFNGTQFAPVIQRHLVAITGNPTPQGAAVDINRLIGALPRITGDRHPDPRPGTPDPGELGRRPSTPSTASVGTEPSRPSSADSQRTVRAGQGKPKKLKGGARRFYARQVEVPTLQWVIWDSDLDQEYEEDDRIPTFEMKSQAEAYIEDILSGVIAQERREREQAIEEGARAGTPPRSRPAPSGPPPAPKRGRGGSKKKVQVTFKIKSSRRG